MSWYNFWQYWNCPELTITDRLNAHLVDMTFDQKVAALKAIVKEVCPGVHVSLNPPGGKRTPKS